MTISERLTQLRNDPNPPRDEWRERTKQQFFLLVGTILTAYCGAMIFLVWLLRK